MSTLIRMATTEDAARISEIYRPYVCDTTITSEYAPPDADAFALRIAHTLEQFPYLVCEVDSLIVGYTYAVRQHTRAAYQWNAMLSIYLDNQYRRHGVAAALYTALMELLGEQGYRNAYACVTQPNEPSMALHHSLGFTDVGVYRDTGFKHGQWRDVIWLVRRIGDFSDVPTPPVPAAALPPETVSAILRRAEARIRPF